MMTSTDATDASQAAGGMEVERAAGLAGLLVPDDD